MCVRLLPGVLRTRPRREGPINAGPGVGATVRGSWRPGPVLAATARVRMIALSGRRDQVTLDGVSPPVPPPNVGTKQGEAFGLPPLLLIELVRTFEEPLYRRLGHADPLRTQPVAQKLEPLLDAPDEGLVAGLLQPQLPRSFQRVGGGDGLRG